MAERAESTKVPVLLCNGVTWGAISEFRERLTGIVRPPAAALTDGGSYSVTLYLVRADTVERRTVTITPDGGITERSETVADRLPVPAYM
jgi:hypothetical protein